MMDVIDIFEEWHEGNYALSGRIKIAVGFPIFLGFVSVTDKLENVPTNQVS